MKKDYDKIYMELRHDPVLNEWIMVSDIRRRRPWQPENFCPFCPGAPETGYGWDVLILENRYPMLREDAEDPEPHYFYKKSRAVGKCYVVIETPIHDLDDLSDLPTEQIIKILTKLREKVSEEMNKPYAKYFLWFRNKGREIGVSLTHPHSQIYVTPFIPSRVERELENSRKYFENMKQCLFCDIIRVEEKDKVRLLLETKHWISFMPFYSHWPFEAHIYPRRHIQYITDLSEEELRELAYMLKNILCGFKRLFTKKSSPYIMVMHQAPFKEKYEYYHMHIEIYGLMREEDKLKYAAGMEMGGGNFTYDYVPEENAQRLREEIKNCVEKNIEDK
ncbi:MAG: galactose-1-phosphate uridylyltransferase [Sulfolobales archaeon]|jgi:UDPglucose--hexose-1-phosphate uridylyltransferase